MSKKFLSVRAAKLLVLAGTDRLDTELTIAQMQGKFQMTVFHDVGHCLHEVRTCTLSSKMIADLDCDKDAPRRLGVLLIDFWKRNDRTDILRNVKKVGS